MSFKKIVKDIINSIKIKIQLKAIYRPFFRKEEKKLKEFKKFDVIIPEKIIKINNNLKNNKKYKKEYNMLNEYCHIVDKHNKNVDYIKENLNSFNYKDIINNPYSINKEELGRYNLFVTMLEEYRCNDYYVNIKNEINKIYINYDNLCYQYENIKTIKNLMSIFEIDKYIDLNETNNIKNEINGLINNIQSNEIIFYDLNFYKNIEEKVKCHNQNFFNDHLFDERFSSYSVDQIVSILTDEVSTLTIAGAGSGKTYTVCGKVKYLIECLNVSKEDILVLSYSKETADDLNNKIYDGVRVNTFHALGLDILKKSSGHNYLVEEQFRAIIEKFFREESSNNEIFSMNLLKFYSFYIYSDDQKQYEDEGKLYEELKKQPFNTIKSTLMSLSNSKNNKETIKKELVKSFEELAIANFYFVNGIDYEYERPYEKDVSTDYKRQYKPDFYLPKYGIYHEHYGIDKEGKATQYKSDEAKSYVETMMWKRDTHKKYNTKCIETFSYEFKEEDIFEKLTKQLIEFGVEFNPISKDEVYNAVNSIYKSKECKSLINLITTFISLYKGKYQDESYFEKLKGKDFDNIYLKNRSCLFLDICKEIYLYYKKELKVNNKIDFDDMIHMSKNNLNQLDEYKYKYIIVDEFQDISFSRNEFLKELIKHGNSKLYAVGDDWQAIYRFSGCDINIFLNFEKNYELSCVNSINKTFRNSQELLNIAIPFITKNKAQIKKNVTSSISQDNPIQILYYENNKAACFKKVIDQIISINENADILVLGRNNRDVESILSNSFVYTSDKRLIYLDRKVNISYKTVHASKGLQADYVVLINTENSILGFPNKIEDDDLLSLVLSSKDEYEYAEERRLFYVALTRTKNICYLLVDKNSQSQFVDEIITKCKIINDSNVVKKDNAILCPRCRSGKLILREDKFNTNFYGCSNYPYCTYSNNNIRMIQSNNRCPHCNDFLVLRYGKYGKFYGCNNYPNCQYTEQI